MTKPKKNISFALLLGIFFISDLGFCYADTTSQLADLKKQIEILQKQAEQYKNQITANQKQTQTLNREISILENKIKKLETGIVLTEKQIEVAEIEITNLNKNILTNENEIQESQKSISYLIQELNNYDNKSITFLILENNELSDFLDNVQYIENLQSQLGSKLKDLKSIKQQLENDYQLAEAQKMNLENLFRTQQYQQNSFEATKVSKSNLLQTTKGQEKKYQQLLSDVEKREAEFFAELQKLETAAVKEGVFIVRVTATNVPKKGTNIFTLPEEDPIITQGYGMTSYAKKGAYNGSPHNGVDMTSGYGSSIRPIGAGTVLAYGTNNGWGNWVAIQHDNNMVSLYGHMKTPTIIPAGQKVDTNTVIGYEGSTGNSTGSHLHLSLYKDFFTYISAKEKKIYFNYFDGTLNPFDYM